MYARLLIQVVRTISAHLRLNCFLSVLVFPCPPSQRIFSRVGPHRIADKGLCTNALCCALVECDLKMTSLGLFREFSPDFTLHAQSEVHRDPGPCLLQGGRGGGILGHHELICTPRVHSHRHGRARSTWELYVLSLEITLPVSYISQISNI